MEKRTYFKTPDGVLYGVSEKVIAIGHEPAEGVVEATDEEVEAAEKERQNARLISEQDLASIKGILPEDLFQKLDDKIQEKKAMRLAAKTSKKQRVAERLAAKEAEIEAEKQAAIEADTEARRQAAYEKRQEILKRKLAEKAEAERVAMIDRFVAEKIAQIEAEKKAIKQAAIRAKENGGNS